MNYIYYLCVCKFLFLILLSVCFLGMCDNKYSCQINGDLEYLSVAMPSLRTLKLESIQVILSTPYTDYNIPNIDDIMMNDKKVGKELNICPPVELMDVKNNE